MLYDNAQLISLYIEAYQCTKFDSFKQTAVETIDWVFNEMTSNDGLFYSALDADSEGVEGKFYVWDQEEFNAILGEDAALIGAYFNITEDGNWEEEQTNILRKTISDDVLIEKYNLDAETLLDKVKQAKIKLLEVRSKRIRPGLDDKCLTAWNGLMIKALADAGQILSHDLYYKKAAAAASFMLLNLKSKNGGLYRNFKNGKASITAFLDDYAFFIEALIVLYEYDFDENL